MAVKAASKTIVIPPMRDERAEITILGTAPLIVHRYSERVQQEMAGSQGGAAKTKKPPRNPQQEFQEAQYRFDGGKHGFPAIGLKRAMVSAGQRFAEEKSTELFGAFRIEAEYLEIRADEPTMRTDRVVIGGMSRTTSLAYRPQYTPWAMDVPLAYNANFISIEQIVNLLTLAGFAVGIGDWRPERKGQFGTWVIAPTDPE